MNPLQALLNAMVYRQWSSGAEHIHWPCSPCGDITSLSVYSQTPTLDKTAPTQDEDTPLLHSHEDRFHNAKMSINGS